MRVVGFTPTSGDIGTEVQISLSGAPQDAAVANTTVLLRGRATVDVNDVEVESTGAAVVTVTVGQTTSNGISGPFDVTIDSGSTPYDATSERDFTVTSTASGEPKVTYMNPRAIAAGKMTTVTLRGQNLQDTTMVRYGAMASGSVRPFGEDGITFGATPGTALAGQVLRVVVQSLRYGPVACPYTLTVQAVPPGPPGGD
jgi:hypothetical protein